MGWKLLKIRPGASLVEILLAVAIASLLLPALFAGLIATRQGKAQQIQRLQATALLSEAQDALRSVREAGWSNVSTNGTYNLVRSGSTWTLVASAIPEQIDTFSRSIVISGTSRIPEPTGTIVTSGGSGDPSTKKVDITVSWTDPLPSSVSVSGYLTRYMDNIAYVETTYNQFNAGTKTGVAAEHTGGDPVDGDVVLSGGGHGDWCLPALTQWGFNLAHSAHGTALSAVEGKAFVVTGDNNSSETFYDVFISNTYPPTATSAGILTGQKKAYGVFGDQTYGYIATDTQSKQGTIIQLSDHSEIGWLDAGVNSLRGSSVAVSGNYAYLAVSNSPESTNKLMIFDISTKSGTHLNILSKDLPARATKIVIVGNTIYAALNSATNQLAIIPITGSGATFGTEVDVTVAGQYGRDVFVNSDATRIYLATSTSATQREMFVLNSTGSTLGSYDTAGMDPAGIIRVTNNKAIIVGSGGTEYQVVDVASDVVTSCGTGLNIDTGVRSVAAVIEADGDAYAYIITGDTASEFKIIEGGPTGNGGGINGIFTSAIYSPSAETAFNRLTYSATLPAGTSIQMQVAVADDCTGSLVYQDVAANGAIPYDDNGSGYENPGRCLRYRAILNSNQAGTTPVLNDVTINYSP